MFIARKPELRAAAGPSRERASTAGSNV